MRGKSWLKVLLAGLGMLVLLALIGGAWHTLGAAPAKPKATASAPAPTETPYTSGVSKEPAGPTVTPTAGPNATLGAARAGTGGCAEMDRVLSGLLANTAAGKAFTSAVSTDRAPGKTAAEASGSQAQWVTFLGVVAEHEGDFAAAAGDDEDATAILSDLETVTQLQPRLLDGRIPKYADKDDAQQQAGAGLVPTPDRAYEQASAKVSQALDRLSWCMPSWPVVF